jgi:hypothetical protein
MAWRSDFPLTNCAAKEALLFVLLENSPPFNGYKVQSDKSINAEVMPSQKKLLC